jgi:hypothetical protein
MTNETFIRNPETGRLIKLGGKTFMKLKRENKIQKYKKIQKVKFEPVDDKLVKPAKLRKNIKVDKSDQLWKDKKPKTKKERQEILKKYGESCFLIPEKLKFPICNSKDGAYNCKGLKAASSMARIWGYKNVLKKSQKIQSELNCN